MALQLRRGTAAERIISGVILAPGELLFTYDDQNLYIGDGVTEGGILVTQRLGGYPIEGTFGNLFLINTVQRTGGVATFVTDQAHGLTPGEEIVITNAPDPSYNGAWTVGTVTGVSEFTVNIAGADLPVQSTALYYIDHGGQFPNGASVVWDQTKQSFVLRGLTKADVGLSNVDNTSDANKPVSTAQQAAINNQTLGQHSNVFLNSPTDGQALIFSLVDNGWINGTVSGGGGGDASFPATYFAYSGLGESSTGKWLGTSTMFTPKSDTNFKSYKAVDNEPIRLENSMLWGNLLGSMTNTVWNATNPGTPGDWSFTNTPQNYYVTQLRLRQPETKKNASFNTWLATQSSSKQTYGKYLWEQGQTPTVSAMYLSAQSPSDNGYTINLGTYYTLYNTGRPDPAVGSDFTFQEYSFVGGYAGTEGKWVGPPSVSENYASQAAAEADGWTVVQFNSNSGYRYYPATGTDGATRVTLPWTFTVNGTACNEVLFSSSAGLLFLPTGQSAYAYPESAPSTGLRFDSPLTERWAGSTNQFYFALNELGGRGYASKCMWKIVNDSPKRTMVLRYEYLVQSYMRYVLEFSIRETDSVFQVLLSPMYNSSGYTYQQVYDNYINFMSGLDKLGTGFVTSTGYVTQNGYLCDEFNMNCHPYKLTDGVGRLISQNTTNRTWLAPLLSAMADITDGAAGSVLLRSTSGYKFATAGLLDGVLTDTSKAVLGSWVYNNQASFTTGNGVYYYYSPQTNYIETQLGRRGADGVDRYTIMLAWTSATVLRVTVNSVNYTVQLERTPTYYSANQFFYVNFDYRYYDGPALQAVLADSAKRSSLAYAPTITAYTNPTNGQVLTFDSSDSKWKPANPPSVADGDKGDITVASSGASWTIDANAVVNTKLADMAVSTIKGRATAGTGDPEDLTAAQVKTILSLSNVENTALSTWTGSSNVTTLGTVATGTWNGTTISIAKGGTGQTTANAAINALLPSQTGNQTKFLTTNGTDTSWGTVSSSLSGLSDVSITSPVGGQILRHNGTTWVNQQLSYSDLTGTPIPVSAIDDLSDVDTFTQPPIVSQVLQWDGTNWVPGTVAGGGGGGGIITNRTSGGGTASGGVLTITSMGQSGQLCSVASNVSAWIVIYGTAAARAGDASRLFTNDPLPGAGVQAEFYIPAGTSVLATPGTTYFNHDTSPTEAIYLAVRDQNGAPVNATVSITAYVATSYTAVSGGGYGSG